MSTKEKRVPALFRSPVAATDAVTIVKTTTQKDGYITKTAWNEMDTEIIIVYPTLAIAQRSDPVLLSSNFIKVRVCID